MKSIYHLPPTPTKAPTAVAAGLKLGIACLLAAVLAPALGTAAPPVLHFSDLDWGPKTGWEGSTVKGAAVTVWGQNLGTTRGSNYITVNGARLTSDSDYAEWGAKGPARGLSRITFWLNPAAQDGDGNISVTVDGQTSNALPFTVMSGAIYFISPTGSNANNGLYSTTRSTGNGPFRDIYMFNPGLDSMHNSANRNPSGDGQYIVYVRAGTYTTLDVDGAFIALRGPYGSATRRKALIGYPGEAPLLNAAAANRGVVWPANYSPYGRLNYFTYAKLNVVNGTWAYGLWGDYNRVVANHMKDMLDDAWTGVVMVDNSQYSQIYGNFFEHCGFDSYKHNIYVKTHQNYVTGDKSVDHTDIGWNEFADAWAGTDARGGVIFISREGGTSGKYTGDTRIHDNYFRDGNMDFIYIGDSTPIGDVTVYNNVFRGGTSTNGGITMYAGTTNAYFYNNTFYQIGAASEAMAWATGTARVVFKNNIWQSRPGQRFFLLESWQGATFSSERDLYYDSNGSTSPPSGGNITLTGALTGNPMFADPAANDFRLLPGSPAIDAGTAAVAATVTRDHDGNPRPQGASLDIGAFEFLSGVPAVNVTVAPAAVNLQGGGSQLFTANVSGAADAAVTWSMNPIQGTLNEGLYTAPATVAVQETVTITATSVADPSRAASATVTLVPPPVVSVSVNPTAASLGQGQTAQFAATVTGTSNTGVTWSLSQPFGTVTNAGLYTAPATISSQQSVQVIATSVQDPARTASATVTLTPPPPPVAVSINPTAVSLGQGQTAQFAATVTGTTTTGVTWSLSAPLGTVTNNGLYTAPASIANQQSVQVIATSVQDPTRTASATVTLTPPPPPVAVSISPTAVSLGQGQTAQFSATVTGTTNAGVTWSLSAPVGAVTNTGLYTAPASIVNQQTVQVIATSVQDPTKTASATVTLTPPPPPVAVSISPTAVSLGQGQTAQFAATVTGTPNTGVTWSLSAPVGAVTNTGLYTAPATISSQQSVQVIATSVQDPAKRASATVTLTPPPPPVAIAISPTAVSLGQGQSRQFTATVTGATTTAVTWSLSSPLGTVTNAGLYTAPATISSQQSVQVIATSAQDPTKRASATVTLTPPPPPVAITISPTTVSLGPGQSRQFTATVTGTTNTAVAWSLSQPVGTLVGSLYTAPASITVQQTVQVIARSAADPTRSAAATVTLVPPPPTIPVTVSPTSVSLEPGQTAQFASNVAVTWSLSPAIGSISPTGMYTAPPASSSSQTMTAASQQTVSVIATSTANPGLSASATVLLLPPPSNPYRVSWTRVSATQARVDWVAPAGRPSKDYIVLTGYGSPDWWYLWDRTTGGATQGSITVDIPKTVGLWEFRYYLAGSTYKLAARSTPIPVNTEAFRVATAQPVVAAKTAMTMSFTAPPGRPTGWDDIVGLYRVGAPNDSPVWRQYTRGATSGTFSLKAPNTKGTYEFRYVIDRTASAVSVQVTVQ